MCDLRPAVDALAIVAMDLEASAAQPLEASATSDESEVAAARREAGSHDAADAANAHDRDSWKGCSAEESTRAPHDRRQRGVLAHQGAG